MNTFGRKDLRCCLDRLEYIAKREAELTFYSNKSKMEREAWVVRNFVDILGLSFNEDEITPGRDEPIDVEFRGGEFQIKELMDDGRRRMDEVRVELARVRALKDDEINTLSSFEPDFVSTSKLIERVLPRMEQAIARYGGGQNCDLLYYANYSSVFTTEREATQFRVKIPPTLMMWRSVSVVTGKTASVLHADAKAPLFLRDALGLVYTNRV